MQYRYFIGIALPTELSNQLASIQAKLFNKDIILAPLAPHITLLPPPAVQHVPPEQLAAPSVQASSGLLPVPITLDNIVTFGRHTLAIDVQSPQLTQLYDHLLVVLHAHHGTVPSRPFHPHVTICQALRGKRLPADVHAAYRHATATLLPVTFEATQLTLYQWQAPRIYQTQALG